jgi:hypothetical protein
MASFVPTDPFLTGEPSLEEMLNDPITLLIMQRDGIKPQSMRGEINRLQQEWGGEYAAA